MISLTTARKIRVNTCLFCQFKAARGRSAFATINDDASTTVNNQPTLNLQKQRVRQLQYDLRHQLLLTTTSDAFKRKFNLKNFEDHWSAERNERTKEFLKRLSQTEVIDGKEINGGWEANERVARKNIFDLILLQLESSKNANEFLRVIVVALERKVGADCIRQHQSKLASVLQRMWDDVEDRRMGDSNKLDFLKTLHTILSRLRRADILPDVKLLELAMLVAFQQGIMLAVVGQLLEIQRHWSSPQNKWRPPTELLDAIVHRGRFISTHNIPGSTITKSEMVDFILESPESLQEVCLETFVDHSRPGVLLRWVRILALYGSRQKLWTQWLEWRKQLQNEKTRHVVEEEARDQQQTELGTEFVIAFLALNAHKEAWKIIDETGLGLDILPVKSQDALLERLELANRIDHKIKNALLEKYERDLAKIEQALRVRWADSDGGYHVAYRSPDDC